MSFIVSKVRYMCFFTTPRCAPQIGPKQPAMDHHHQTIYMRPDVRGGKNMSLCLINPVGRGDGHYRIILARTAMLPLSKNSRWNISYSHPEIKTGIAILMTQTAIKN